jgi:hypothetical protein
MDPFRPSKASEALESLVRPLRDLGRPSISPHKALQGQKVLRPDDPEGLLYESFRFLCEWLGVAVGIYLRAMVGESCQAGMLALGD